MTLLLDTLGALPTQNQDMPLRESYLLGFDTETTGTRAGTDAIVSASLVLRAPASASTSTVSGEDVLAGWIIQPDVPMSPGASAVNGFTNEYLAENGMLQTEALPHIAQIIRLAQEKNIPLVAYNAPFDVHMLQGDLAKLHAEPLDIHLVVDPLVIDRTVSHRRGKRTLTDTTRYYGVQPRGDFHTAQADTVATLDLIEPLTRLYPSCNVPLESLMEYQRAGYTAWKKSYNEYRVASGYSPIRGSWL
ncbi:DNA polymerase III subunit epsilon [Alloscardovia macacae]|uniref:DNA polymerase III subunit epsilon n=1 Tax=Alloscardovia macacae TaxID=1160091 RepID=A0A1Y2SX13_9BIFI|nr:exonuclease domain-containing protein [Alloscardovia macacae]OTA26351.1 DNA polymerase III subunit epsilon [Alloscardovia macacae]OTA28843.1 DNA polymerase III subunit epsilon [Alloscardovia macacae]